MRMRVKKECFGRNSSLLYSIPATVNLLEGPSNTAAQVYKVHLEARRWIIASIEDEEARSGDTPW